PSFAASWDMLTDDWVIGLAFYGNSRGNYKVPKDGPQRYMLTYQEQWRLFMHLAAAGEFWDDRIRIGLGLAFTRTWFRQDLKLMATDQSALSETTNPDALQ